MTDLNNEEKLNKLRDRINEWENARDAAPTNETMWHLKNAMDEKEAAYEIAMKEYRIAAVKKAVVYGWQVIADDLGVSAKMLHSWRKTYCPEIEDLSTVPANEAVKENRIIQKMSEQADSLKLEAEKAAEFKERIAARQTRLDAVLTAGGLK